MPDKAPPVIVEERCIRSKDGDLIEIGLTQEFIDRARQHFGLFGDQRLEDDHVRMYLWGAVNTAVSKAERELDDVGKPAGAANTVR